MSFEKIDWRKRMRSQASLWEKKPEGERARAQSKIDENLNRVLADATGVWAGYSALPGEPVCTFPAELTFAFPKVEGESLRFFIPTLADSFADGEWGLKEPDAKTSREVSTSDLAGFLIPGLAFDRNGIRLGRGKGFYDRTLADFQGPKIGVAFNWQIANQALPCESFDVPMDIVVTDEEIIRREKK